MIQLYRIQLTSQTPFRCKILRAFVFLFIGNSIHSICTFFERRKCVYSVVIFNKGIEETFEVSCANFYDNCPRRAIIQGQLFGGQSCRGQLSSGAIVWGAIIRGGTMIQGAIVWGQLFGVNFPRGQLSGKQSTREQLCRGQLTSGQFSSGAIARWPFYKYGDSLY